MTHAAQPSSLAHDAAFAELRRTEFARLDRLGEAYLDWTGAALYGESQLRAHEALLRGAVLGNPHSESAPSRASTSIVEGARARVLAFFGADPREWTVCFAANASGAIRLVAESYPFASGSQLLLAADNHNSMNGIREHARAGKRRREIRRKQEEDFPGRPSGTDLSTPDFVMYAKAFGCVAFSAANDDELWDVFDEALAVKGPVLVELKTSLSAMLPASQAAGR